MSNIEFHPEAEAEFNAAIDYYEEVQPMLGLAFANEVQASITRISDYPEAWSIVDYPIRRCLTNRFPFGVLYSASEKSIVIIAVMHLHREPNYWKKRL